MKLTFWNVMFVLVVIAMATLCGTISYQCIKNKQILNTVQNN